MVRRNPVGFKPRVSSGFYKKRGDYIYVTGVVNHAPPGKTATAADWWVCGVETLTDVKDNGPTERTQAADVEMALLDFTSAKWKRVKKVDVPLNWVAFFERNIDYALKENPGDNASLRRLFADLDAQYAGLRGVAIFNEVAKGAEASGFPKKAAAVVAYHYCEYREGRKTLGQAIESMDLELSRMAKRRNPKKSRAKKSVAAKLRRRESKRVTASLFRPGGTKSVSGLRALRKKSPRRRRNPKSVDFYPPHWRSEARRILSAAETLGKKLVVSSPGDMSLSWAKLYDRIYKLQEKARVSDEAQITDTVSDRLWEMIKQIRADAEKERSLWLDAQLAESWKEREARRLEDRRTGYIDHRTWR